MSTPLGAEPLQKKEVGRWAFKHTVITLIDDPYRECYTMCVYKYDKLIAEESRVKDNRAVGMLIATIIENLNIKIELN